MAKKDKETTPKRPPRPGEGRPTKYKPEYCNDIVDYFERCQAEIMLELKFFNTSKIDLIQQIQNPLAQEQAEKLNTGPVKEIGQKLVMQRFPTYIRYARSIGVAKSTLFEWASEYKEFSDSMGVCKEISEAILLENGLQGTYNPQFAMFLLKNNHSYKDKSEQEHTGKDGGAIEIKVEVNYEAMTPKEIQEAIKKEMGDI